MLVLKRLGSLTKNKEGRLILINENKEGYVVDELIAFIWMKSDNRSREQLNEEIATELKTDANEIKDDINKIVDKLKDAQLLKEEEE